MGKPQPTQLPDCQNYQSALKWKTQISTFNLLHLFLKKKKKKNLFHLIFLANKQQKRLWISYPNVSSSQIFLHNLTNLNFPFWNHTEIHS